MCICTHYQWLVIFFRYFIKVLMMTTGWMLGLWQSLSLLAVIDNPGKPVVFVTAGLLAVYCLSRWALKVWMLGVYAETREEYPEI